MIETWSSLEITAFHRIRPRMNSSVLMVLEWFVLPDGLWGCCFRRGPGGYFWLDDFWGPGAERLPRGGTTISVFGISLASPNAAASKSVL